MDHPATPAEQADLAKEELTEAYLEGQLSDEDRRLFEAAHSDTETKQRRLRILRAIKEYALRAQP